VLGGGAAHAHAPRLDVKGVRQVLPHGVPVVPDPGPLADHDRVHVGDLPALSHECPRLAQEFYGVGVSVALVGVGEVVTDVLKTGGPEQGVGNGVGEDVGVGMAEEALFEGNLYPAEDELATRVRRGEGVNIEPDPDAENVLGAANL
jgi:hypothetical protein